MVGLEHLKDLFQHERFHDSKISATFLTFQDAVMKSLSLDLFEPQRKNFHGRRGLHQSNEEFGPWHRYFPQLPQ